MTLVRSPLWDGVWILSAPLTGALLLLVPTSMALQCFFVLNAAHLISPAAVAWGHSGFRPIALARWRRFLLTPAGILIGTGLTGMTAGHCFSINPALLTMKINWGEDYLMPFAWLFPIYFAWNSYHFGAQNFGITGLYLGRWQSKHQRAIWKWGIIAITVLGMHIMSLIIWGFEVTGHVYNGHVGIPQYWHVPAVGLFALGFFSFNHSLAAVGLSSHVLARHHARSPWLFAAILLAAGALGFWLLFAAPGVTLRATMTAIGLRLGLGFIHFLYDRWVWRFSDPQVRETIGQDIFRRRGGPYEVSGSSASTITSVAVH